MKSNRTFLSITILLVIAFIFAGCGIIPTPTPTKGAISGQVLIPPGASEMAKDITGWVPAADATVTVVDANGVTHTVTTDENGYYSFENIAVNSNTVITATVTVDGKTVVLKGVIPQSVAADEDYNAGTMTSDSTALALVVEKLIDEGLDPDDINLAEIQANDSFANLVEQVTTVIEEQGNVTEDPGVIAGAGNIADEILNPLTPPSPPLPPSPPDPKHSTYAFSYEIPCDILVGEDITIDITFQSNVVRDLGYEGVRFSFEAAGPGEIAFTATDSENNEITQIDSGFWGPASGFDLPADYNETTEWTINFSESGEYTITFSLIFAPDGETVNGITGSETINYYDTIQGAIDAADEGDIICVTTGIYTEIVDVHKGVTLKAASRPVLTGPSDATGPTLTVSADNVTVTGLEIRSQSDVEPVFTSLVTGNNVVFSDLKIVKGEDKWLGGSAVKIGGSVVDNFTFENSVVASNWNGIYSPTDSTGSNYVIKNVNFTYPGEYAIQLHGIDGITIEGNTFIVTGNDQSYSSPYNDKEYGVFLGRSSNNVEILDNFFESENENGEIALLIQDYGGNSVMDTITVTGNHFSGYDRYVRDELSVLDYDEVILANNFDPSATVDTPEDDKEEIIPE